MELARKIQPLNVDGKYPAVCKKLKRIGVPNINNKNIQPGYRNGIWYRKIYHANNGKRNKNNGGIELPGKERIRMLEEKET